MSILVSCPSCEAKFAAPEEAAGKSAHCPKCEGRIVVPKGGRLLATESQKEYARDLGIDFPADCDRTAMSRLIDTAVDKRDEERIQRLNDLEEREEATNEGIRLATATPDEIVKALYDRGLTALLITMQTDEIIDFEQLAGLRASYSFTDNMRMKDVESLILTAAAPILDKRLKH
jgi:hypothetical protein